MISKVLLVDANLVGVFFHIELIVQQLLKDIDDKKFSEREKKKKKMGGRGVEEDRKKYNNQFQ